jgi:hypothetical protein
MVFSFRPGGVRLVSDSDSRLVNLGQTERGRVDCSMSNREKQDQEYDLGFSR